MEIAIDAFCEHLDDAFEMLKAGAVAMPGAARSGPTA
jgi:hypothetical protein